MHLQGSFQDTILGVWLRVDSFIHSFNMHINIPVIQRHLAFHLGYMRLVNLNERTGNHAPSA